MTPGSSGASATTGSSPSGDLTTLVLAPRIDEVSYIYLYQHRRFSEYLFLLTILTKPQSGFKIAFSMLDRDGNERIDKEEFKVSACPTTIVP